MGKLSEMLKNIWDKVKNMSMVKKVAFSLLFFVLIGSFVLIGTYMSNSKYGILFSNLAPDDAKVVTDKLKADKVETKIIGNAIYVPKTQVDSLRLELATSLSNGSKGYELLDSGNQFGMTDEEFKIKKQRVTQGELEKTIKSFPQIQNARVHITPAETSVFVRDSKPGKAAVYLQLKYGTKLSSEQVKAIIALLVGSLENVPQENIEVIDDKMNLLSKGLFDDQNSIVSTSLDKQKSIEADFEAKLEKALKDILEPAIGKNKVSVKVNADLDFDSKEKSQISYDPNKVAVSTHTIKENASSPGTAGTQSPIDNNMSNTTTTTTGNSTNTREEATENFNVGKTESKVISAPGEVKRLTASVMIDGKLDDSTKTEIQKIVANAIGFKADRGDDISIMAMNFDSSVSSDAKTAIDEMNKQAAQEKKMETYKNYAYIGGGIIGLLLILFIILKSRKKKVEPAKPSIDVVLDDQLTPKEPIQYPPIDFENESEKSHIEKEIKKYASDKPDQVADIVRSWLAEDER